MRWLSLVLPGSVEDAFLYAGQLLLLSPEGELSIVAWNRLVEATAAGDGLVTTLLARNDALDAERAALLRQTLRPAVARLAGRRLEAAAAPFVVQRMRLGAWADAAVYRRRLYYCRADGLWSAPLDPSGPHVLGEPKQLDATPAHRVRPSPQALAVVDAEGLALHTPAGTLRVVGLVPRSLDWHGPNWLAAVAPDSGLTLVRLGRRAKTGEVLVRACNTVETPARPANHVFGEAGELWAPTGRALWRLRLDTRAGLAIPHDRIELPQTLGRTADGTVTTFGAAISTGTDLVWIGADGAVAEATTSRRVRAFPHSSWYRRLVLLHGDGGLEVRCYLDDLLADAPIGPGGRTPWRPRSGSPAHR